MILLEIIAIEYGGHGGSRHVSNSLDSLARRRSTAPFHPITLNQMQRHTVHLGRLIAE